MDDQSGYLKRSKSRGTDPQLRAVNFIIILKNKNKNLVALIWIDWHTKVDVQNEHEFYT